MEVPSLAPYEQEDWPEVEKGLAAMITRMDRDVGRILQQLEERGIDDDTIVMFTSDNGPHNSVGHWSWTFNSAGGLRGYKTKLYEGGIRVPLVARWPGRIAAGSQSDHLSHFADVMPTLAELADIDPPPKTDGFSFVPTLVGNRSNNRKPPICTGNSRPTIRARRCDKDTGRPCVRIFCVVRPTYTIYPATRPRGWT